jgi:hypothetical protein
MRTIDYNLRRVGLLQQHVCNFLLPVALDWFFEKLA